MKNYELRDLTAHMLDLPIIVVIQGVVYNIVGAKVVMVGDEEYQSHHAIKLEVN